MHKIFFENLINKGKDIFEISDQVQIFNINPLYPPENLILNPSPFIM
jgi:hypothetical protein